MFQIKYTQGGTEALEIARKYFAQAVKLNSNNIRALYGMFVVSMPEHNILVLAFNVFFDTISFMQLGTIRNLTGL